MTPLNDLTIQSELRSPSSKPRERHGTIAGYVHKFRLEGAEEVPIHGAPLGRSSGLHALGVVAAALALSALLLVTVT